jgi:hypothetical protein
MSVHPHIIKRNHTFAAEYYPAALPTGRHSESTAIRSYFVLLIRHKRGILLKVEHFIVKFISLIYVDGSSVSLALPVSRNVDICPASGIERGFIKVFRTEIRIFHPMEFPFTVEAEIIG